MDYVFTRGWCVSTKKQPGGETTMRILLGRYAAIAAFTLVGCADSRQESSEPDAVAFANETLGIVEFQVREWQDVTSVSGIGADGKVVGRMDITHGVITLSDFYGEAYETPTIEGRRLEANVGGQQIFFEVHGYDPIMGMPAHPADKDQLAAFLEDPHVEAILTRWGLGFLPAENELVADPDGELPFIWRTNSYIGKTITNISGQVSQVTFNYSGINSITGAPYTQSYTATSCGSKPAQGINKPSLQARLVTSGCGSTNDHHWILQHCPVGSAPNNPTTNQYEWFAQKSCPVNSLVSACGTIPINSTTGKRDGACLACPTYTAGMNANAVAPNSVTFGSPLVDSYTCQQNWYQWVTYDDLFGLCAPDSQQCGNSCTNTQVDPNNCGFCGVVCATGNCVGGYCVQEDGGDCGRCRNCGC